MFRQAGEGFFVSCGHLLFRCSFIADGEGVLLAVAKKPRRCRYLSAGELHLHILRSGIDVEFHRAARELVVIIFLLLAGVEPLSVFEYRYAPAVAFFGFLLGEVDLLAVVPRSLERDQHTSGFFSDFKFQP